MKLVRALILSASAVLVATAAAKIVSGFGSVRVLDTDDPIFQLPFRQVFFGVAALELVVASICIFTHRTWLHAAVLAWLSTSFLGYRLGLLILDYHRPCGCLGTFTDSLGISPNTAEHLMGVVLTYLLLISYGTLFWLWKSRLVIPRTAAASGLSSG